MWFYVRTGFGNLTQELALLDKLSHLVSPGRVLVVKTVAPIGFIPNLLRRFLLPYLVSPNMDSEEKSAVFEEAFSSHRNTLGSMTRNARDWVQDNMLNPTYFGLCLSISVVIERLRENYDVVGASPSFAKDWRWFKPLAGTGRQINAHIRDEYWLKARNYLDHREPAISADPDAAKHMEQLPYQILAAVEAHEDEQIHPADFQSAAAKIRELLVEFMVVLPVQVPATKALQEFVSLVFGLPVGVVDAVSRT